MGYIEANLMPNEKIVYKTKLHKIIFVAPILLGTLLFLFGCHSFNCKIGWFLNVIALIIIVSPFIQYKTSEFAVTTKRVIIKTGFIERKTVDMFLSKIEGISVYQDIVGRMFDFGTITIIGTGGTQEPFKNIENPLRFRMITQEQIDPPSQ